MKNVICVLSLLIISTTSAIAEVSKLDSFGRPQYVAGEVLVKLDDSQGILAMDSLESALSNTFKDAKGSLIQTLKPMKMDSRVFKIRFEDRADVDAAIVELKKNPAFKIVERNGMIYLDRFDAKQQAETRSVSRLASNGFTNDPEYSQLWGMSNKENEGMDINVEPVWKKGFTGNDKIVVAVVDTGIQTDHKDLKENIYTNPKEIPGNGKDDDKNGLVDDVHGWNFNAKSNDANDDNGHGTHCAGTIGAVANNAEGVVGVAWKVKLMPVKFLDANGSGSYEDGAEAVKYAISMKVNVMSNSWGGSQNSEVVKDAFKEAEAAGVVVVAAAGNNSDNSDESPSFPAGYDFNNMISVAAVTSAGKLADFSNYGKKSVHVAAPGKDVFSTYMDNEYKSLSGTSMATPHVAGIAALLLSEFPKLTAPEVKAALIKTSRPVKALKTKSVSKGMVDVEKLFQWAAGSRL